MNIEHLVEMANQIGDFFNAETNRSVAVSGVANHMSKFWERRMRKAIIDYEKNGGVGLEDIVREAIRTLSPVG